MKKFLSFKTACDLTSILGAFLTIGMVFFPYWTISMLGVSIDETAAFTTRRMGLLFFGLLILMIYSRNLTHSKARSAIAKSVFASMSTLAILGLIEYFRGNAGLGIIYIAVVIEIILTIAFLPYCKNNND